MKIIFLILTLCFPTEIFGQPKESYSCIYFNQILKYIQTEYPEKLKAMDSIGGKLLGAVVDKKFIPENTSKLPDSIFFGIFNRYDLENFSTDPMLSQDYSKIIVVDTLFFFDNSCRCFNSDSTKYSLAREWIFDNQIKAKDTLLIKLLAVMAKGNQLQLIFTSNYSKRNFGFFNYDLGNMNQPTLVKVRFDFLHIYVDQLVREKMNNAE